MSLSTFYGILLLHVILTLVTKMESVRSEDFEVFTGQKWWIKQGIPTKKPPLLTHKERNELLVWSTRPFY